VIGPEALVTFDAPDGFRVVRSVGQARGEAHFPQNLLRATFRTIGVFIGLAPVEYLTDAERARSACIAALLQDAESLGANGVVGLQFRSSEQDGGTRVTAFGEAVVLEPLPDATSGS
jgi:uncharacterized protein YbjQ (UPF0145 family)